MFGYLRLLVNSRDELALARVIDIPHRGLDHHAFTDVKHEACHRGLSMYQVIYFASAAVAVDSSNMTTSSSSLWSRFGPPSNFVNGYLSTMWFMVCRWPQSQEDDWSRSHLCKLAQHGPGNNVPQYE